MVDREGTEPFPWGYESGAWAARRRGVTYAEDVDDGRGSAHHPDYSKPRRVFSFLHFVAVVVGGAVEQGSDEVDAASDLVERVDEPLGIELVVTAPCDEADGGQLRAVVASPFDCAWCCDT